MDENQRSIISLMGWGLLWMGIALAGVRYNKIDASLSMIIPLIVIGLSLYALAEKKRQ